jgi:hypothetical protein
MIRFFQMQRVSRGLDWIIDAIAVKGSKPAPNLPDIDTMRNEGKYSWFAHQYSWCAHAYWYAAKKKREAIKEEKKEAFKSMLQRQLDLHVKSRTSRYPGTSTFVFRFNVPDEKVDWQVIYSTSWIFMIDLMIIHRTNGRSTNLWYSLIRLFLGDRLMPILTFFLCEACILLGT